MVKAPSKKPKDTLVGFRVSADMKKAIEREARADGRSVSGLLQKIVTDWLDARKKRPPQ